MKKKRKMVVQRLLKHRASKMQWFSLAGMLHLLTAWTRPQRIIREYARTQHNVEKLCYHLDLAVLPFQTSVCCMLAARVVEKNEWM